MSEVNDKSYIINKILNATNTQIYQKNKSKINASKTKLKVFYRRNSLSNKNLIKNNKISFEEKNPHFFSYHLINEQNLYKKMKDKFLKIKEEINLKDYSNANNSILNNQIINSNSKIQANKIKNIKKFYSNKRILSNKNNINQKRYYNIKNKNMIENYRINLNGTTEKISINL